MTANRFFSLFVAQSNISCNIFIYNAAFPRISMSLKTFKLDGNYTRMLREILNKSWRQHPTKQQLYGHQLSITKTIQVR